MSKTSNPDSPAYRRLTRAECVPVHAFMVTIIDKVGEYATYHAGWSDERVAEDMKPTIPHVHAKHIARYRCDVFGRFPPRPKPEPKVTPQPDLFDDKLAYLVGKHEHAIQEQAQRMDALDARIKSLEEFREQF